MAALHKKERGFTLIEMMIVVSILAILAAVALPRYSFLQRQYSEKNAARQLGSDIRYAWQLAVDEGGSKVAYRPEGYDIIRITATGAEERVKSVTFAPGITITSVSPPGVLPGALTFGSPGETAAGITFQIQRAGGGTTYYVGVSAGTGKVTVDENP